MHNVLRTYTRPQQDLLSGHCNTESLVAALLHQLTKRNSAMRSSSLSLSKSNLLYLGVQCKLHEARKQQLSNVAQFLETVKEIEATQGLVQTCEVDKSPWQVPTKFGNSPAGSFGSYQLSFHESNFTVTSSFEPRSSRNTNTVHAIPTYLSFPLDDWNDAYTLPMLEGLDRAQKNFLDSFTVS